MGYQLKVNPAEARIELRSGESLTLRHQGTQTGILEGNSLLPGKSHYFIGSNPAKWRTGVPHYGRVLVRGLYQGIDLAYYGHQGRLEHDYFVQPGADPACIRFTVEGVKNVRLEQGRLLMGSGKGEVAWEAPVLYQDGPGGREKVAGEYVSMGGGTFGFKTGPYDRARLLVIDPTLTYSTFLGGTVAESLRTVVTDSTGIYVCGDTTSSDFPLAGAIQGSFGGNTDCVIAKLDPTGTTLLYATYLGGSNLDYFAGLGVDASGQAVAAGSSWSSNFPTVSAFQSVNNAAGVGGVNGIVAKLNASGSALIYSTYIGGNWNNPCVEMALDPSGNAYLIGMTDASNFPTSAGSYQATQPGGGDAYVAKFSPTGSRLYSTYLGGSAGNDEGYAIAADAAGNAYITGRTVSSNYPTLGAFQSVKSAGTDVFVTKLNPAGNNLVYSTFLGGSGAELSQSVEIDASGAALVTGQTSSANFPLSGAFQAVYGGGAIDVFVTKLNPSGASLDFSTYLGGSLADGAADACYGPGGEVFVTGYTTSANFPLASPYQASANGGNEVFVSQLDVSGSSLLFSTYFGGTANDNGDGIFVNTSGIITITGGTASSNYPVLGAYQATLKGASDGFITQFSYVPPTATMTPTVSSTGTFTRTATPTVTPSASPTATETASPTPSSTPTASPTATRTSTPTASPTVTQTASPSPSATPTASLTFTVSPTYTETPFVPLPVNGGSYIYPSPVKGPLANVVIVMEEPGTIKVTIYNERADLVQSLGQSAGAGLVQIPIDVRPYASGVYLYRVVVEYASGRSRTVSFKKFAVIHE